MPAGVFRVDLSNATGLLADGRLSSNVPLKNAASNTFTGNLTVNGTGVIGSTTFTTGSMVFVTPGLYAFQINQTGYGDNASVYISNVTDAFGRHIRLDRYGHGSVSGNWAVGGNLTVYGDSAVAGNSSVSGNVDALSGTFGNDVSVGGEVSADSALFNSLVSETVEVNYGYSVFGYFVNTVQVIGLQQPGIANVVGSVATIHQDDEARAKIDEVIAAMRAHGLIAT
jgi:hypothetical protein